MIVSLRFRFVLVIACILCIAIFILRSISPPRPVADVPAKVGPNKTDGNRNLGDMPILPQLTRQPYLHFQRGIVVGNQVKVLVEAGTNLEFNLDAPSKIENLRYYLLTLEFSDDHVDFHTVIGPVVQFIGSISSMANETGLVFTDEDRAALAQKPRLFFTVDGQLRKSYLIEDGTKEHQWMLQVEPHNASWKEVGIWKTLPLPMQIDNSSLESPFDNYVVQKDGDGIVRVYDLYTGKQVDDEWLMRSFADLISRDDLANSVRRLTKDLRFLIVFPNRRDFKFDDVEYSWRKHGLLYTRSKEAPNVFSNLQPKVGWMTPYSISGQLCLVNEIEIFVGMRNTLEIRNAEGKVMHSHQIDDQLNWMHSTGVEGYYDEQLRSIAYLRLPYIIDDQQASSEIADDIHLGVWNFEENYFQSHTIKSSELFEENANGFYPRRVLKIDSSDVEVEPRR